MPFWPVALWNFAGAAIFLVVTGFTCGGFICADFVCAGFA
jgi:hypothetical protein